MTDWESMTKELRQQVQDLKNPAIIESYISGPRWALPAGWVRKAVIDSGLNIDVVYENRETSLVRCTIFFKLRGSQTNLRIFCNGMRTN